jgi:hypothetical protein
MNTNPSTRPDTAASFDTHDEAAERPAEREAIKLAKARQNAELPVSLDPAGNPMDAATALIIVAAVVLAVIVGALYWALRSV